MSEQKTFEEIPSGTLFAQRDYPLWEHKPYEIYIKLRDPYRWDLPNGSGFMNINAVKIKNGARRSVNCSEPVKRVGFLLAVKELFAHMFLRTTS